FPHAQLMMTEAEYAFWASPLAARAHFASEAEPAELGLLRGGGAAGTLPPEGAGESDRAPVPLPGLPEARAGPLRTRGRAGRARPAARAARRRHPVPVQRPGHTGPRHRAHRGRR